MINVLVLIGAITAYAGQPLYCGGEYSLTAEPWIALDAGYYETGAVECGDVILVSVAGSTLRARALDAGHLAGYQVIGTGHDEAQAFIDIIADPDEAQAFIADEAQAFIVPAHLAPFAGTSAPGRVINYSALCRAFEERVER